MNLHGAPRGPNRFVVTLKYNSTISSEHTAHWSRHFLAAQRFISTSSESLLDCIKTQVLCWSEEPVHV
jgi:hypothetical protein